MNGGHPGTPEDLPGQRPQGPNQARLQSLRQSRATDEDWSDYLSEGSGSSRVSQQDSGQGQRSRGTGGRGRGRRGRGRRGPEAQELRPASPSPDREDTDSEEEDQMANQNIRAWDESTANTSDTHDDLYVIPMNYIPESFSDDESDGTIQTNYKKSVEYQKYRVKVMARKIFKERVIEAHEAGNQRKSKTKRKRKRRRDTNDNSESCDENSNKNGRNRPFLNVGLRRQQQRLREVRRIFGNDTDMQIEFAKSVFRKEGIVFEDKKMDDEEKNMLVLSAQAKNKLTKKTYESLRFTNLALKVQDNWPSWKILNAAKQKSLPENIHVDQLGASYPIRDVVLHTVTR